MPSLSAELETAPPHMAPAALPAPRTANPTAWVAFLCGFNAFLDLYCTQPLLPSLARVFHASESMVSLTISASTLGVAISALLLAVFGEGLNRKRTIVSAIAALAVLALLTATASSLAALSVWRLLQGLVTPGIFIITIAYITEEWPAGRVPQVMSVYVAGTVFGGFLGRMAGGLLGPAVGWRGVFVVLGLVGLAGAALTQWLLPPSRSRSFAPPRSRLAPVLANLRNGRLLATFAIGFCMLYGLVSVFSYITFYLDAPPFNLSTAALSSLFAVYLVGLVVTLVVGRVLAKIGLRHGMVGASAACVAGVALTLAPSLPVIGLGLALASSGVFLAQTCANSFLRDAAPLGGRVSAAGMYICSYYIGGTVGGMLPGALWKHGGWPGCVALTAALLAGAGFIAFFGWRQHAPDPIPL